MSDDLIKRLLDLDDVDAWPAADRVKQLEESNKELTLQLLAVHGQAADVLDRGVVAEARLAKALETLRFYAVFYKDPFGTRARAVLAELEGGE